MTEFSILEIVSTQIIKPNVTTNSTNDTTKLPPITVISVDEESNKFDHIGGIFIALDLFLIIFGVLGIIFDKLNVLVLY